MAPPPLVTGVSPKEGPPGTLVTVRGDFLGTGPTDLIGLTICGCDCHLSAEWKSPKKILARSGPGKGRGDIIVITRSGGKGTSTVQFRGYHETIGPMKESAVWVEEAPLQTLVWSRRSLSPTGYQQEDPLGLSVEGNDKKFPEDDLHELFPEGSGDLASEQFCAGWFLLEHHHATTFDDLKAGVAFLRRKVEGHKEGQLSFLKTNVGSVMEQLDTLSVLKEKFEEDVQEHGSDPTQKVENAIQESMLEANKLFEEVLARRDRADATRNALGVLHRYKFLFCLPVSIERNIRKGDYDVVINDYARAKNLFGETDIAIFKKVLVEVEQRINNFREILRIKLKDMPSTLEEQKRIIRNLVNLEASGDPAWEGIECHSSYLLQRLTACRDEHLAAEQSAAEEQGKSSKPTVSKMKTAALDASANMVPQRVLFVEELAEILAERFPDLWKLGMAYFSGELHVQVSSSRDSDFKHMVLAAIEQFARLLRGALLPHTLDRMAAPRRSAAGGSWPNSGAEAVGPGCPIACAVLHCMSTLFHQAADHVKALHKQETWKVEFDSQHGGISDLPLQFERKVQEVVQQVREAALLGEAREKPLLAEPSAQRELNALSQALLLSFHQALETLAFSNDGNQDDRSTAVSQLIGAPTVFRSMDKDTGPPWEQRLLMTLSNCQFTAKVILSRLSETFSRHGYPVPTLPIATASSALSALDKRIMEVYLEQKSDPLVGTIEPSMYLGRFDWDTPRKPSDISPYVKEIIANMNGVHAEVHRVSPALVSRVLCQIVETVAEELSRLMSCVTRFSCEGRQQATADIQFVQETVRQYTTQNATRFFVEALDAIPPLKTPAEKKVVEDVLSRARARMRLQLLCFSEPRPPAPLGQAA
ncbi:Exocyst complex component 2 [Gryllus bimaculatus]|nr:Exocyst complex component 2 [Gryllus bimaculatus]